MVSVTVEEVAKAWQAATTTKRASTAERDEVIIRLHILPAIGHRQIGSVTKADIQKLVDSWAATKAATTVGRQYTCLGAIFSYGMSDDIIMRSPCHDIRLPKTKLKERPVLTPKQVTKLGIRAWSGSVVLHVVRHRRSEVVRGSWHDSGSGRLDEKDHHRGPAAGPLGKFEPPKSELGKRTFAINEALVDDLTDLIARQDSPGLLFTDSQGGHLRYSNWRRRTWNPACEVAGLPDLTFHDLRALAGTMLIAAGADIKTAQTRLGHANPQTTLRLYARAQPEADRLAADAAGAMMRP